MNWYRTSLLFLTLGLASATGLAQAPVGLGRPTRLASDADRVNVFQPIRNTGAFPPPTVVRGARASSQEPPIQFLPKTNSDALPIPPIPKITELKPLSAAPKNAEPKPVSAAPKSADPPPTPTATQGLRGAILPATFTDDIIIVDETGEPIFGDRRGTQYYGSADWLLWWLKGFRLPPLVTTASPTDVIGTGAESGRTLGAIGFGTTRVIIGNEDSTSGPRSGGRFTIGRYLDPCGCDALEATVFVLAPARGSFFADSSQFPVLARPFINVNRGTSDRQLVATPVPVGAQLPAFAGFRASGSVLVETSSRLWGAETNLRRELETSLPVRLSGLIGFRYLELSERLSITESINPLNPIPGGGGIAAINVGDNINVFDNFETRNRFYGGQLGLNAEWQRGRWTFDTRFKIALGANRQIVDIFGQQTINRVNGTRETFNGGLLALNSNSGRSSQTRFSAVPEVGLKVGYALTENVSLYAGYDFLCWSNVLRPGDQVDPAIDVNRVPNSGASEPPAGVTRPVVPFRTTNFWAQGVTAGLQIRY